MTHANPKDVDEFISDDTFSTNAPKPVDAGTAGKDVVNVDLVEAMMKSLNADQLDAVNETSQNVLLLAPAGTGKTRVMTARYLKLLSEGADPERVLSCTFTNAAARELIERLEPVVKIRAEDLWVGTTHSIGLRIIRYHAGALGLANVDTIIDTEQQREIILRLMREQQHPMANSPDEQNKAKRILEHIEKAKIHLHSPREMLAAKHAGDLDYAHGIGEEDIAIYDAYEVYKVAYDMIDYNDMLYLPTRLLEGDRSIRTTWQSKFDHIMVDEYQDLSSAQIRMLRNLVDTEKTSFFAAADDDQSIYGWRGSSLEGTMEFRRFWPGAKVSYLLNNYRTPKPIFDKASSLIRHNANRHPKDVRTRPDDTAFVKIIEQYDSKAEKEAVHLALMEGIKRFDVPLEKVAVLCRSNKICQEYASYLASQGLPVNLHESLNLGAQPIRALVSWMQLATAADNPLMFQRLATYPEPFFNESQIVDIEARVARQQRRNQEALAKARAEDADAKLERTGPIGYLKNMVEKGGAQKNGAAANLIAKVDEIRAYLENPPEAPFSRVADKLGIIARARQSERTEDHQISDFIRLADEMAGQIGLAKTLASLTSLDFNAGRKGINVATMHGAKGLEYEIVALPGWQDGDFPSYQRKDPKEIEEERRVAYVAITRARKMLIISWSGSGNRPARPSTFLHEAGLIEDTNP